LRGAKALSPTVDDLIWRSPIYRKSRSPTADARPGTLPLARRRC
jgi:hypothetical protein